MVSKYALPYLLKGENAHVLNLAPPIDLHPPCSNSVVRSIRSNRITRTPHSNTNTGTHTMIAKYNMAMCAVGMAEEYRGRIGFNNLWLPYFDCNRCGEDACG